jgi:hypothetical protein
MRNRVLEATGQDPCGRLPAPDSYTGSAAPSIAGVSGHPTRFSPWQDVARDREDSYKAQVDRTSGSGFLGTRTVVAVMAGSRW